MDLKVQVELLKNHERTTFHFGVINHRLLICTPPFCCVFYITIYLACKIMTSHFTHLTNTLPPGPALDLAEKIHQFEAARIRRKLELQKQETALLGWYTPEFHRIPDHLQYKRWQPIKAVSRLVKSLMP